MLQDATAVVLCCHVLTMNISFTKKPMKPIRMKPMAVLDVILLNSAAVATAVCRSEHNPPRRQQRNDQTALLAGLLLAY